MDLRPIVTVYERVEPPITEMLALGRPPRTAPRTNGSVPGCLNGSAKRYDLVPSNAQKDYLRLLGV